MTVLGEYAKDYATNIDGVKLTSSEKRAMTVEQLRPTIVGEELLLMLEKSVRIEADGYKDAVMTAMYVRDDSMIIVYQSGVTFKRRKPKVYAVVASEDFACRRYRCREDVRARRSLRKYQYQRFERRGSERDRVVYIQTQ